LNYELLRERAVELEKVAQHYAALDPVAAGFYEAMKPYLRQAMDGTLPAPLEIGVLPSRVYFDDEGTLRKYRELEDLFSRFSIEATGGETPALKAFLARIAAKKSEG
jgi:hypothetical protein